MKRPKSVDDYVNKAELWRDEMRALRKILLSTDLEETVKWAFPCYTYNNINVVGLAGFKQFFGLWFYQGALLKDERNVLINAQRGKTKAMRQWRFASKDDIKPRIIKSYVLEAIELAREGREVKIVRNAPVVVPAELKSALAKSKKTQTAFKNLTPGKQREFAEYIATAKQDATKVRRVEKILPMIQSGVALHDKYRR